MNRDAPLQLHSTCCCSLLYSAVHPLCTCSSCHLLVHMCSVLCLRVSAAVQVQSKDLWSDSSSHWSLVRPLVGVRSTTTTRQQVRVLSFLSPLLSHTFKQNETHEHTQTHNSDTAHACFFFPPSHPLSSALSLLSLWTVTPSPPLVQVALAPLALARSRRASLVSVVST